MYKFLLSILSLLPILGFGQAYTSYFTGNTTDVVVNALGGVCLMGGASEDDNAMQWFLQRANGGDVLVLRTSGSDGYNSYLYSSLGVAVNSVETIVCNSAAASSDPYVLQRIQKAEAIWFAGGDQWTYIDSWRNTPFNTAINQAINQRKCVIGGTSAGMAIQGKYYFSAKNGTVTSSTAMANPFNNLVTIDSSTFLQNTFLDQTLTDTHFDNPDRKGRLVAFLARIQSDYGVYARAIACDEYTAVCIDTNGIASVFGGFPTYDDNAYFIQSNCELAVQLPENCSPGNPLTWDLGGQALKVYQIKGEANGSNTFDLNTWETGSGGTWQHWSVSNGNFIEQSGSPINCSSFSVDDFFLNKGLSIHPNPTSDRLNISMNGYSIHEYELSLYNELGQRMQVEFNWINNAYQVDLSPLKQGVYFITAHRDRAESFREKVIRF